ncbi:hypothetical protein [Kitasatospora cathayae]|uniref:Uncharacterized protein n=1 Tax=Kitasatospora cathayae TaxID=3004092 RepID=A0ABY7PXM1_9ACTN|nr:hypothetical protein [Kitasatospora sp. HUAS 3-15]WBP85182.1 hypothetical protein O1G21_04460 [Kitasatospora sp. HUAS 3-15]
MLAAVVIAGRTESSAALLTPWSYWPAAAAFLLTPTLGYAVIGPVRAARRRRLAPENANP